MELEITREELALADIVAGPETQARAAIDMETVEDYAEAMKAGVEFPDIVVFFNGLDYIAADGFHRIHAARHAGRKTIWADVHQGMTRDAIKYALQANAFHGLKRNRADKLRCLEFALRDLEWQRLPNSGIAKFCKLSASFVANHRDTIVTRIVQENAPPPINPPKPADPAPPTGKKGRGKKGPETKAAEPPVSESAQNVSDSDSPSEPIGVAAQVDANDNLVPADLNDVFLSREDFKRVANQITIAMQGVKRLAEAPGGYYLAMHRQSIEAALRNAKTNLLHAAPHALVTRSPGHQHPNWVSQDAYKALPERERVWTS